MAYPQDKEIFNRVVNQNLTEGEQGSTLDQDHHNKPVDFLERLQDTLGLDVNGAEVDLNERLNVIEAQLIEPFGRNWFKNNFTIPNTTPWTDNGTYSFALPADQAFMFFMDFGCNSIGSSGVIELSITPRFNGSPQSIMDGAKSYFQPSGAGYFKGTFMLYSPSSPSAVTCVLDLTMTSSDFSCYVKKMILRVVGIDS